MAVDDHGLEVLKKSAEEVSPGDKSDYYLKVKGEITNFPSEIDLTQYVDDLESLITASNALLTLIDGSTDAVGGYVDQLEGLTDDIKTLLTSISGFVDQIEPKLDDIASNTAALLTDTQLRASPIDVAGPLTDTELRATPVPVSGPLTNTELRAVAVPVSGPLTDAALRATPVPVSGTVGVSSLPAGLATESKQDDEITKVTSLDDKAIADTLQVTGSISNGSPNLAISTEGYSTVTLVIVPSGLGTQNDALDGTDSISFRVSPDGTNWYPINGTDIVALDGQIPTSSTKKGAYTFNVAGWKWFRVEGAIAASTYPIAMTACKAPSLLNQILALTYVTASDPLATAARQDLILTALAGLQASLSSIDNKLTSPITVVTS